MMRENIKFLRKKLKFTQEKFAKELGFDRNNLVNWELGRSVPKLETVQKIARYFNVGVEAMYSSDLEKELSEPKTEEFSVVKEDGVLYGLDPMMKDDEPETPEQATARIAVLKAYIKTLSKENEELKDFIETNLKIKI